MKNCKTVKRTWSFWDGTLGPTSPPLSASAGPDGEAAYAHRNAKSSWDHFNYGDLSRNIFSLKQKAATLRISLQHFQHIWLQTAGEAGFSTNLFILVLEVCQLLVGLQGGWRREQQLVREAFLKSHRTDFGERRICGSKQPNSNHFILKTSHQTENSNSLCLQDLDYRCQAGKRAYVHFALHTLGRATLNKLFYESVLA